MQCPWPLRWGVCMTESPRIEASTGDAGMTIPLATPVHLKDGVGGAMNELRVATQLWARNRGHQEETSIQRVMGRSDRRSPGP